MNKTFRFSSVSFSPTHLLRTLKHKSCTYLQTLLTSGGILLLLNLLFASAFAQVVDPTICLDPGGLGVVVVNVTNPPGPDGNAPQSFTATIPPGVGTAIANSCTATVGGVATGSCVIAANGGSLTWNGSIANNATLVLTYRVRIASNVAPNTVLVINNTATSANPGLLFPATSSLTVGCPAAAVPSIRVSDQKPGSILVFPYYTSGNDAPPAVNDTRISLTNISPPANPKAFQAFVHVFLVEGSSCMQTDFFVCLTPGATYSFNALSMDPVITGYIIAIAVDAMTGLPVQNNVLVGNAFLNTPNYYGNYGAESFAANSTNLFADQGTVATLFFDGIGYDPVPKKFAVEIQSLVDVPAPFQRIVTAGMIGDLSSGILSGAAQSATGQIINEQEDSRSINNLVTGACQAMGVISDTVRVGGGLANFIPSGRSGTVRFEVGGAVGLLLTPRNTRWGGVRTLHKTATVATSLTIPVFFPNCPTTIP
jgi:hypothetical protein